MFDSQANGHFITIMAAFLHFEIGMGPYRYRPVRDRRIEIKVARGEAEEGWTDAGGGNTALAVIDWLTSTAGTNLCNFTTQGSRPNAVVHVDPVRV